MPSVNNICNNIKNYALLIDHRCGDHFDNIKIACLDIDSQGYPYLCDYNPNKILFSTNTLENAIFVQYGIYNNHLSRDLTKPRNYQFTPEQLSLIDIHHSYSNEPSPISIPPIFQFLNSVPSEFNGTPCTMHVAKVLNKTSFVDLSNFINKKGYNTYGRNVIIYNVIKFQLNMCSLPKDLILDISEDKSGLYIQLFSDI